MRKSDTTRIRTLVTYEGNLLYNILFLFHTVRGPGTVVRTIPLTLASCGLGSAIRMSNCARTPLSGGARARSCDFSGAQLDTLNLRRLDFSYSMCVMS
jgi:hypothetical protein